MKLIINQIWSDSEPEHEFQTYDIPSMLKAATNPKFKFLNLP